MIQEDIDTLGLLKAFKSRTSTSHIEWIADLITQIKIEIKSNPSITDNELFDKFIQEDYQYYSHSNRRKLRQDYSVKWAINKARSSPEISTSKVLKYLHNELAKSHEQFSVNNIQSCFKYTISDFKSRVSKGVTYISLMELIHFTFIFFTNKSPEFNFNKHIAFLDEEEELQIKSYDDFIDDCKTDPITIKLCRYHQDIDNTNKQVSTELYIESIPIKQALVIFDCFKQKYYQWDIYSYDPNVFSLYCNPIKPTNEISKELPQPVSEILDLICSVLNDDANGLIVNYEEKNFILDWFAYILQHPESRNKTGLCIVTEQGVGKNLLTNTICNYLTKQFSNSNISIDQIIGQYTIDLDRKLLAVINEVDRSKKDSDKLKSVITDETIYINKKFGLNRNAKNACSYVFFSNHFDTKIISNGDRRFTLIRSIAKPKSKEWYNKIAENQMFKEPYASQFINNLLSRDLSKYSPDSCPDFAKTELFKIRNDATSVIQRIMVEILTKCDIEYLKFTDIVTDLNTAVVNGSTLYTPTYKTLYNKYIEFVHSKPVTNKSSNEVDVEEEVNSELATLIDLEHELVDEYGSNKKNKITNRLVNNVINFEDDKDLYKTTYKRSYTVIKLKSSLHKPVAAETEHINNIVDKLTNETKQVELSRGAPHETKLTHEVNTVDNKLTHEVNTLATESVNNTVGAPAEIKQIDNNNTVGAQSEIEDKQVESIKPIEVKPVEQVITKPIDVKTEYTKPTIDSKYPVLIRLLKYLYDSILIDNHNYVFDLEEYTTAINDYIKNHVTDTFANIFKALIHNSYYDEFKSTVNGMLEEFGSSNKLKSITCKSICTKKYSKYIVEIDELVDQTGKLIYTIKEDFYEITYGSPVKVSEDSSVDLDFEDY